MVHQMTISTVLSILLLASQTLMSLCTAAESPRPNVVVFLADDQGWGDLSVHGNTNLSTPEIDSLARDGARFEHFFVCSVCAPTRAEFLTGRYHSRGGVRGVSTGRERLNVDERTVAEAFQQAGYATAALGKWHNGTQGAYHPRARGFDEYYGFTSGHWGHYFDPILEHNGTIVRGKGFITDDLTNHAIDFIEQHKERPFFCYLPYNTPHSPFQVPDEYWNRFRSKSLDLRHRDPEKEDLDTTRCALAMCENIDWNVGRVLRKLDELQLTQNTIVVYFSDNGPNSWRWNAGMKGRKGSTDEGGLRSPLLIRWPAQISPGTVVSQIAGAIDLLPTLVDLVGIQRVGSKPLDGRSLRPLLEQTAAPWPDRMLFSHQNGQVSVRTQQYRLDANGRLFDLTTDPGQRRDISNEQPELTAELRRAVAAWKVEVLPPTEDDRPFPVAGSEFPVTYLPARDGQGHGNIKRSASAPNCSFFTNWTSSEDRITWDVEVSQAGEYQVEIYYTCPAADIGSVIELRFGDNRLVTQINEAHDPPLYGMEADRVERKGESYVKDFRPLAAGAISLAQGRAPLTLRALSVPGSQVMDVRGIVLTRKP
jgi:arylsulfatase A-like enzyme